MHGETIGSYLHRLADANHTTVTTLAVVLGHGRRYQRADDTTDGWPPEALPRLAALTSRTIPALLHALPALRALDTTNPDIPPGSEQHHVIRLACRLCAARLGIHNLVLRRTADHEHLCPSHRRWLTGSDQLDVSPLPDVLRAHRHHHRIQRRHGRRGTSPAYPEAARLTLQWFRTSSPPELHHRWNQRLAALPTEPFGDPHRPSDQRVELATYPESVILTSLLTSTHWRHHDRLPAEASRRLGIPHHDLTADLPPKNSTSMRKRPPTSQRTCPMPGHDHPDEHDPWEERNTPAGAAKTTHGQAPAGFPSNLSESRSQLDHQP